MTEKEHWAVDKRVPISSIAAGAVFILGQTWFLAWVVSSLSYRMASVEDFTKQMQPIPAEMAVMKEKITSIQATLNKFETLFFTPRSDTPPLPATPAEKPTVRR